MYVASENGDLLKLDQQLNSTRIFHAPTYLMGLASHGERLFVGGRNCIYEIGTFNKSKEFKQDTSFHHMDIVDEEIYIAATTLNEIWVFDLDLKLDRRLFVSPPNPNMPVHSKRNYNHINKVFYQDGLFYVCLNWLTSQQYGPSGVAVFDTDWNELDRFQYGWEMHGYCRIEDEEIAIAACSTNKAINHPLEAGIIKNGELKIKHDHRNYFCKDLSIEPDVVYMVGGKLALQKDRKNVDGVIYELNPQLAVKNKKIFPESGGLKGCLTKNDLSQHCTQFKPFG